MRTRRKVFICYTPQDERDVDDLYLSLLREGFEPWMDRKSILPGEDWRASVEKAARSSDFFLACLSGNAVDERRTLDSNMQELLRLLWKGSRNDAYLIPVRLVECNVPESLVAFEYVDLFRQDGFQNLVRTMEDVAQRRSDLDAAFAHLIQTPDRLDSLSELRTGAADEQVNVPALFEDIAEASLEGPEDTSSVFEWGVELRKLLNGERESALLRLGGVEEYVEVMLAESPASALSDAAFHEALRNLVQVWQPSSLESEYSVALMLDLIGIYTPPQGFLKVVSFITRSRHLAGDRATEDTNETWQDLHLKALVVLENYYSSAPMPPEDESPAYQTYLDILREDSVDSRFSGYAVARLIALKVVDLEDAEVQDLIQSNPKAIKGLVTVVLDPNRRSTAQQGLRYIYTHCLEGGDEVERAFQLAIASCGGQLDRDENGPVVQVGGHSIPLRLPPEALHRYWLLEMERARITGMKNVDAISANAC